MNDTSAAHSRYVRALGIGSLHAVAAACAMLLAGAPAHAVSFDFDNPDIKARWDTTVGYTLGLRTARPSSTLTEGPGALNFNDGDLNFAKRKRPITNRLDVFSEADVSYRNLGARISATGWYDQAYRSGTSNTAGLSPFPPPSAFSSANTLNSGSPGEFAQDTRDLHGSKAELLDAFVFGKVDLGSMPLNMRLGRHALLWGESLFFGANAIAGGMAPIDIVKAQSSPNSTIKEIIRPVGQLSGQLQVTHDVSVGAYYQYDWEKSRLPAAGSYYSTNDTIDAGGERLYLPIGPGGSLVPASRSGDVAAPDSGQGGVQTHFRIPGSAVDFGLYAIRFHAKLPVAYLDFSTPVPNYRLVYPEKINAYGTSFNTTWGDVNLGGEASVRTNTPLSRGLVALTGGPGPFDASDHPSYPVGRTAHLNLSTIYSMPSNVVAREANLTAELAWNRVLSCTQNCANVAPSALNPFGFTPLDGNAERDAWGFRVVYTPTYRQALNGVDLNVPVGLSYSPKGKSGALGPVFVDKGGDMSIGLSANVREAYTVSLNFTHYYGSAQTQNDANGFFTFGQTLKDRDNVTLSARMSF